MGQVSRELTPLEKAETTLNIIMDHGMFVIDKGGSPTPEMCKVRDILEELIKDLRDTNKIRRIYQVEPKQREPQTVGLQPRK